MNNVPNNPFTSGLKCHEKPDGSLRLEVCDYNVGFYGGADYESWYELDAENAKKLIKILQQKHSGELKTILIAEFGENFTMPAFEKFCRDHEIIYYHNSWIG